MRRLAAGLLPVAAAVLTACGGGGDAISPTSTTQGAAYAQAADGTVASDLAQPSAEDPGVLQSDGTQAATAASALERAQAATSSTPDDVAVALGDLLFHDESLSTSGKMACGTCHVEDFGHADRPGTTLPKGGPNLDRMGMRSTPTARYLKDAPPFRLSLLGTPSGGFLWDGRADDHFGQVFHGGPFFNPNEQALAGSATAPVDLTSKVRAAAYWPQIQAYYATQPQKIATDTALFREIALLIEAYQQGDPDYNRFDSKFDRVQAGSASFTASEARGWALFSNASRGNCTSCHSATLSSPKSLFTNYGYSALAVPRNHVGPKNADANYYDLGLCAREKASTNTLSDVMVNLLPRYCGLWKTPTLRNVSRTSPYFHNGAVKSLEDAVRFHFERDTATASKWYRKADGSADRRYNDLPLLYLGNLTSGRPFNGAYKATDQDVADLVAFLKTLDDSDQTVPLN